MRTGHKFAFALDGLIRSRVKGVGGEDFARKCIDEMGAALDEMFDSLYPGHILKVKNGRWALQHPLSCRPNLLTCSYHNAIDAQFRKDGHLPENGVYDVTLGMDGWPLIAKRAA